MLGQVIELMGHTIRDPKAGARRILDLPLNKEALWTLSALVVLLSVILTILSAVVSPDLMELPQQVSSTSPVVLAMITWAGLVISAMLVHFIGRMFGGTGSFEGSLRITIWLQLMLVAFQVVQLGLLLISPGLATLANIGFSLFALWLFLNFIAEVHRFASLAFVLAGVVGVTVACIMAISILSVSFGASF